MHMPHGRPARLALAQQQAPVEGLLKRVAAENLILVSSGGSDWLPSSGRAERVEGGYRVTARKIFASGCPMGDMLMTSAVHDDPEAGPTVLHFGVPFKAEGRDASSTPGARWACAAPARTTSSSRTSSCPRPRSRRAGRPASGTRCST